MKLSIKNYILSIIVLFAVSSCIEDSQQNEPLVSINGILYVSSTEVLAEASILSLGSEGSADDIGFQVSTQEDFSNPIELSLGNRNSLGKILGEVRNLEANSQYYIRSYLRIGENLIASDVEAFQTLKPITFNFSPTEAEAGETVVIQGNNLSEDVEVFFDGRKAEVLNVLFNSKIEVKVPPFDGEVAQPLSLRIGDSSLTLEQNFEYITGDWEKMGEWPDDVLGKFNLYDNFSMQIGEEIFFGMGTFRNTVVNRNVFSYNISMDSVDWLPELSFSLPTLLNPFIIDNNVGGGFTTDDIGRSELPNFSYFQVSKDGASLIGTLKESNNYAVGMSLSGGDYIFGGVFESSVVGDGAPRNERLIPVKKIWKFNEVTRTFDQVVDRFQGPTSIENNYPYFVIDGVGYFVDRNRQLYKYDELTQSFVHLGIYPLGIGGNDGFEKGISTVVNGKAYVGLFNEGREIMEYDPVQNTWKRKKRFLFTSYGGVVASGVQNNKIYVIRNPEPVSATGFGINTPDPIEIWRFDPEAIQ